MEAVAANRQTKNTMIMHGQRFIFPPFLMVHIVWLTLFPFPGLKMKIKSRLGAKSIDIAMHGNSMDLGKALSSWLWIILTWESQCQYHLIFQ